MSFNYYLIYLYNWKKYTLLNFKICYLENYDFLDIQLV